MPQYCSKVSKSDHVNPRAFYSGHYQCPGLNIQAVCDSKCHFIYFSVAAVGSTPDCSAFAKTDLPELLGNLPYSYYILGDCAYICTNNLLIPYAGSHRDDSANDSFNFHLSQLRIKIEQAFGVSRTRSYEFIVDVQTSLCCPFLFTYFFLLKFVSANACLFRVYIYLVSFE